MSTITDTDSEGRSGTDHTQDDFAIGDVVADREADTDGEPVVVNLPPVPCDEWDAYQTDDGAVTVAEDNPKYAADSEVVVVMFDEELDAWGPKWDGDQPISLAEAPQDATYAFPPGRLEPAGGEPVEEREEADDSEALDDSEPADEGAADEADAEAPNATLRDRLDAIADTVRELNVDDVAVDTFREVVVVEKLGKQYAIDTEGEVDADDLLAGKLEGALDESGEVGE